MLGPNEILKMYKLYDEYIGRQFSVDYWSDEGISQAALILVQFDISDWQSLAESCIDKPDGWGVRCAETLCDIADANALMVLLRLLRSGSIDVRVAALDSIRSLMAGGVDVSAFARKISDAVSQVRAFGSIDHVVELILTSLEKKLDHA